MCALENLKPPRYMATRLPNQMGPYNVRVLFWKVVWCKSYLANECQPWRLPGQPSTWKAEPNRCTHWPISRIIPGPLLYKQCVCNWFMRCSHPLSCETRPNDFFLFLSGCWNLAESPATLRKPSGCNPWHNFWSWLCACMPVGCHFGVQGMKPTPWHNHPHINPCTSWK